MRLAFGVVWSVGAVGAWRGGVVKGNTKSVDKDPTTTKSKTNASALKWGVIFGILQGIITLVVSIRFSSPEVSILACLGLIASVGLSLACGLIATIDAKKFFAGFAAGLIATAVDTLSGILGYILNPSMLDVGLLWTVFSLMFSIVLGIIISAVGAGIGVGINKLQANPSAPTSPS